MLRNVVRPPGSAGCRAACSSDVRCRLPRVPRKISHRLRVPRARKGAAFVGSPACALTREPDHHRGGHKAVHMPADSGWLVRRQVRAVRNTPTGRCRCPATRVRIPRPAGAAPGHRGRQRQKTRSGVYCGNTRALADQVEAQLHQRCEQRVRRPFGSSKARLRAGVDAQHHSGHGQRRGEQRLPSDGDACLPRAIIDNLVARQIKRCRTGWGEMPGRPTRMRAARDRWESRGRCPWRRVCAWGRTARSLTRGKMSPRGLNDEMAQQH